MKTDVLEPTEAEILELHQEILLRDDVRRRAQLPRLDVKAVLQQEIEKLRNRKFETMLRPYLTKAYQDTPGCPGVAGRLRQSMKAREKALRAMEADIGVTPEPRNGSVILVSFLSEYSRPGRLPPS